jgi:acetate kinase
MAVALGGVDLIVFTGGIGEHDAAVRQSIRADLDWAGAIPVRVIAAQENRQIARHVARLRASWDG